MKNKDKASNRSELLKACKQYISDKKDFDNKKGKSLVIMKRLNIALIALVIGTILISFFTSFIFITATQIISNLFFAMVIHSGITLTRNFYLRDLNKIRDTLTREIYRLDIKPSEIMSLKINQESKKEIISSIYNI